jgi:hypothetical protein
MNPSDKYLCPRLDQHDKTLDGINLQLEPSNSLDENSTGRYQKFKSPHSKFAPTGLWRKKRDIAAIKINHSR